MVSIISYEFELNQPISPSLGVCYRRIKIKNNGGTIYTDLDKMMVERNRKGVARFAELVVAGHFGILPLRSKSVNSYYNLVRNEAFSYCCHGLASRKPGK